MRPRRVVCVWIDGWWCCRLGIHVSREPGQTGDEPLLHGRAIRKHPSLGGRPRRAGQGDRPACPHHSPQRTAHRLYSDWQQRYSGQARCILAASPLNTLTPAARGARQVRSVLPQATHYPANASSISNAYADANAKPFSNFFVAGQCSLFRQLVDL